MHLALQFLQASSEMVLISDAIFGCWGIPMMH